MKALGGGEHSLRGVRLLLVVCVAGALVGATAADAAGPPQDMLGTWTRTVSKQDVARTHAKKIKPGSTWTLVITADTSSARSPGAKPFTGHVIPTGATLVNIELGKGNDLYGWRRSGKTLLFTKRVESNPDREAVLVGTWKRH
jgi:hypothetical protein